MDPDVQADLPFDRSVGDEVPVCFVRHPRARRYRLRVERDGRVRMTIPRGGSRREAERFVRRHDAWIRGQRERLAAAPRLSDAERCRHRARASEELPARLAELAVRHGLAPPRVGVGDQRTRWGSCSRTGRIRLNWRLVLMPDWVRDYVIIHELMHLRRLDHGPAFWALVGEACPAWRDARRWLRRVSPDGLVSTAAAASASP